MSQDDTPKRRKAVALARKASTAWADHEATGFTGRTQAIRFVRAANRAETALMRVALDDLDDPRPRLAYGYVSGLRSAALAAVANRLMAMGSIGAARGALWAYDHPVLHQFLRPGLSSYTVFGELVDRLEPLVEQPPVETEFTSQEGTVGLLTWPSRFVAAADARLALAHRLASFRPRPLTSPATPRGLDAFFRSRGGFFRPSESFVWECQAESCQGASFEQEAATLTREAVLLHELLEHYGDDTLPYGPAATATARRRAKEITDLLPLDWH